MDTLSDPRKLQNLIVAGIRAKIRPVCLDSPQVVCKKICSQLPHVSIIYRSYVIANPASVSFVCIYLILAHRLISLADSDKRTTKAPTPFVEHRAFRHINTWNLS